MKVLGWFRFGLANDAHARTILDGSIMVRHHVFKQSSRWFYLATEIKNCSSGVVTCGMETIQTFIIFLPVIVRSSNACRRRSYEGVKLAQVSDA